MLISYKKFFQIIFKYQICFINILLKFAIRNIVVSQTGISTYAYSFGRQGILLRSLCLGRGDYGGQACDKPRSS